MGDFERHDMIYLSPDGRVMALEAARKLNPGLSPDTAAAVMNPVIPGIVRRREQDCGDALAIGFSAPFFRDGVRVRAASYILAEHIDRTITPFEAADITPESTGTDERLIALERLKQAGLVCGVNVGVYGSFALELITGLNYTTTDSDLDIFISPNRSAPDISGFFGSVLEIQAALTARLDIEARCKGGYGVKLRELLSDSRTVLGKGSFDVRLLPRGNGLFTPD